MAQLLDGLDVVYAAEEPAESSSADDSDDDSDASLGSGGAAVLTTTFVSPWHASPSDYFRFSPEGLRALAESHGFGTVGAAGGWGDRELLGRLIQEGYSLDAHDRRRAVRCGHRLGSYDADDLATIQPMRLFHSSNLYLSLLFVAVALALGRRGICRLHV